MSKKYAVEYLDEEANLKVILFDEKGLIEEYVSHGVYGNPGYKEPRSDQFYLSRINEETKSALGEEAHWMTILGCFSTIDEVDGVELPIPAYEKVGWHNFEWLHATAVALEENPDWVKEQYDSWAEAKQAAVERGGK